MPYPIFKGFRPARATTLPDNWEITRPDDWIAQAKYDGVRILLWNGQAYSRRLLLMPNKHLQAWANQLWQKHNIDKYTMLDGELVAEIAGTAHEKFTAVQSYVMTRDATPAEGEQFSLVLFDGFDKRITHSSIYQHRKNYIEQITWRLYDRNSCYRVDYIVDRIVHWENLEKQRDNYIVEGFEGMILRNQLAAYQLGKVDGNKTAIYKYKATLDGEAQIQVLLPERANNNIPSFDMIGNMVRSSHKDNLETKEQTGTLVVYNKEFGQFLVSGFTNELKRYMHENQDKYIGRFIEFRYSRTTNKGKPLHPVFARMRYE